MKTSLSTYNPPPQCPLGNIQVAILIVKGLKHNISKQHNYVSSTKIRGGEGKYIRTNQDFNTWTASRPPCTNYSQNKQRGEAFHTHKAHTQNKLQQTDPRMVRWSGELLIYVPNPSLTRSGRPCLRGHVPSALSSWPSPAPAHGGQTLSFLDLSKERIIRKQWLLGWRNTKVLHSWLPLYVTLTRFNGAGSC